MLTAQKIDKVILNTSGVAALSLLAGMVLLFSQAQLPAPEWSVVLAPLLLICWKIRWGRPVFWLLVGFFWAAILSDLRLSLSLPDEMEGKDLRMSGEVVSLPRQRDNGSARFLFQIESVSHEGRTVHFPALVRLNWYYTPIEVRAGQKLQFTARLKQPHGFSNPGGFDWEQWLFEQGIRATGYVRDEPYKILQQPRQSVAQLREQLSSWLRNSDSTGMLAALAVGDRQGISTEHWKLLRNTGISHLIAISGLHIGLIATLLFFLFRRVSTLFPRLLLYLPAQQVGAVGALIGAVSYAALAGFSVPTQRALIMVTVVMAALLLRRALTPWRGYFLALGVVLLFDPFVVLSAGFWLSFSAVGWILLALPQRSDSNAWMEWLRSLVKIQLVLLVGMLPLLLYLFQQGSLVAPLVNLLVVPWVSLLVVPLTLFSVLLYLLGLPGAALLLELSVVLVQWMMPVVEWFATLDFSHFALRQPMLWMVVLALAAVWIILSRQLGNVRWLAALLWLPMLLWPSERPHTGEAWVTVLDVGQGLAVVVESRHKVLVYDTGDRFSATFDAGSSVLIPFLRSRGWSQIDLLVIGHGDRDHIGGMHALTKAFTVVESISSVSHLVKGSRSCRIGQQWRWSEVEIEVLHPDSNDRLSGNDRSCVLRIAAGEQSVLLTGDIEAKAEQLLLERFPLRMDADAVVVPHHGSESSSTSEWIEQVSPQWAVIPAGYRNRYRLPRQSVIERYQRAGGSVWNSADSGAVEMRLGGEESGITAWRMANLRFWSDLPRERTITGKILRSPNLME